MSADLDLHWFQIRYNILIQQRPTENCLKSNHETKFVVTYVGTFSFFYCQLNNAYEQLNTIRHLSFHFEILGKFSL